MASWGGGSYPSAEVQSAYSTAPADRVGVTVFFWVVVAVDVGTDRGGIVADFPRLRETEVASCERLLTECEVRDALKQVGLNKSSGLDGLPYEVYSRLPHMFVPILTDVFNHLLALRAIPDSVTKDVITLLKKGGRYVWEELDDYKLKTLLNTELKILA